MPNEIQDLISSINTQQFAYPQYRETFNGSNIIDGWDINYKWFTFKQMVTINRGYDYWLWPIPVLRILQKAELLHHTANPSTFSVIRQCDGRFKESNKNDIGRTGSHITFIRCGEDKRQAYMHDTIVWRSDYMHEIYRWYAKTGGWI